MVTRAGSRRTPKSEVARLKDIPKDLAGRWELIRDFATDRIFAKRKQIKEAIGDRPYRGLPVDETELQARWAQIRNDTEALSEVFQSNAKFRPDGRVLVPKALIEGMVKQEKKRRDGGDD